MTVATGAATGVCYAVSAAICIPTAGAGCAIGLVGCGIAAGVTSAANEGCRFCELTHEDVNNGQVNLSYIN